MEPVLVAHRGRRLQREPGPGPVAQLGLADSVHSPVREGSAAAWLVQPDSVAAPEELRQQRGLHHENFRVQGAAIQSAAAPA